MPKGGKKKGGRKFYRQGGAGWFSPLSARVPRREDGRRMGKRSAGGGGERGRSHRTEK